MKRTLRALCAVLLLAALAGCAGASGAEEPLQEITTPEEYCAAFDDADLIVADDGSFYVEATKVQWVTELDLADTTPIAAVARSGVSAAFEAWDATRLPEGTAIARHNVEAVVLVAAVDGGQVPYLLYASSVQHAG